MIQKTYIADEIRMLSEFCIAHHGRCFEGCSANKIFRYVAYHYLRGTLSAITSGGQLLLVMISWPDKARDIKWRHEHGRPQFDWRGLPSGGDSVYVDLLVGHLHLLAKLWPFFRSYPRFYFHVRGKLHSLNHRQVERMLQ